ncbi:MAG: hypothetical protein ACUVQF_02890 [Fervidobacterium sp.]|uniref:hypothetical protein n=1 Tax=Fervidobacterium sp. TaxID=1871331 RepID=UPI004049D020
MKKVLWVFAAVIVVLLIVSCTKPEQPQPEEKDLVTLDATFTEWGDYLYTDGATDSAWGDKNEIHKAGIMADKEKLYIAGEFTKEGYNNFMVIVDVVGVEGATDTSKHPWGRGYTLADGDIDFIMESWEAGQTAWRFTTEEATEVEVTRASTVTENGHVVAEWAVPLSQLGWTEDSTPTVKAVFVLTGGLSDEGTKQWLADLYPDQEFGGGGYSVPVTIVNTISYPAE